jgi:hypothetical protein
MTSLFRGVLCSLTFLAVFVNPGTLYAKDAYYKALVTFFAQNFPGEQFIPTAYGADDRYAPKTIWIEIEKAVKRIDKTSAKKAWFAFNSGRSIYPDSLVRTQSRPITASSWSLDKESKWAISAALSGNIENLDIGADFNALIASDLEIRMDIPQVEIEYVWYWDLLFAQAANEHLLTIMNDLLRARYGKGLPRRRVITAAIRVKDANITVRTANQQSVGANLKLSKMLNALGFSWNKSLKEYRQLKSSDWKYLAFQAVLADETGKISSAERAGLADEDAEKTSLPSENLPWAHM